MEPHSEKQKQQHHHHILPTHVAVGIGATLLFLTGVTVWIAGVDLGPLNFVVAMAVATTKAVLVALFFMNLYFDRKENGVIFVTSFVFLAIFFVLTSMDLFFRGDVAVKGPLMIAGSGASKLKKPWISTPELVAKGKELFAVQCVSCHGVEGRGDGPAASSLNPPPRNFTSDQGWKNGRKATMIFKTLKEGLPPSAMASYATLPQDDRWALTQYVLTLSSAPVQADTPADFAKVEVDPTKEIQGEKVIPTLPVDLAMEQAEVPSTEADKRAHLYSPADAGWSEQQLPKSLGARVYAENCMGCHGTHAQGGIEVARATAITQPLNSSSDGMKSQETFNNWVVRGLPGNLMPGFGQLSTSELQELYHHIQGLTSAGR